MWWQSMAVTASAFAVGYLLARWRWKRQMQLDEAEYRKGIDRMLEMANRLDHQFRQDLASAKESTESTKRTAEYLSDQVAAVCCLADQLDADRRRYEWSLDPHDVALDPGLVPEFWRSWRAMLGG